MQGACENGMEKETNEEIDEFFSQFGQIIRKTWFSTYKGNRQPSRNRSFVMQINEGMGIKRKLMYTGITSDGKGRIRVNYKGQPYLCGRCNTVHESQCPKRKKELIKEVEEKLDRRLKTKTLVVSDSTLRLTNQLALNADVTCIRGGQIGHLANSLNYNQQLLNYENVIIVGGVNNIDSGVYEDHLHLNMIGTNLLLTEISKHVEGFKRKEAAVQQYNYSKVRSESP